MIVYTGEKQFNYSVCGKGFGQKGDLNRLMVVFMQCALLLIAVHFNCGFQYKAL